jgi:DNA recombination protein RmuC
MAMEYIILILILVIIYLIYVLYKKVSEKEKPEGFGEVMNTLGKLESAIKKEEEKREKIEKARDERIDKMAIAINDFNKTISGTKSRGGVGEEILKQALSKAIQSGLIKTNLKVDNSVVEFAWNLGNGKYIPIDAKLPDVIDLYKEFNESEDVEKNKKIKKEIENKIKKNIDEIGKYKNKKNTINKCILAVPDGIIELLPDINNEYLETGIAVCGYRNVFLYANLINEEYQRTIETGDVGECKQTVSELISLMKDIQNRSKTIEKGVKEISGANEEIKKDTIESERYVSKKN